jgi:predicted  nucleic acid-binding Zn-ribbon protein
MRDAHKRLEVIFMATANDAAEGAEAEQGLDEFQRLKKKIHGEIKKVREALKEREIDMGKGGNTTAAAEASYRIRVMIKTIKETIARMQEIYDKQARKKKQKDPTKLETYKETMELCKQHLEEVEGLEKRRALETNTANRVNLLQGTNTDEKYVQFGKGAKF